MGRAFVIDVNSKKSNEKIRVEDIEPYRSQIESVQVVLFRTDWHKKAGTEEFMNHPHLSENSGHYLQKFGIQTVGIDAQLILMQPVEISFLFMTCMLL
jgi:kynurenine formamidase